jgi:hypothetical protein
MGVGIEPARTGGLLGFQQLHRPSELLLAAVEVSFRQGDQAAQDRYRPDHVGIPRCRNVPFEPVDEFAGPVVVAKVIQRLGSHHY